MSVTKQENKQTAKANKKTLNDEIIMDPNKEDILCGKEKHCVSHPGSINFRAMIDQYASKYQDAVTKNEKMAVTKEIYDLLGSQNSRFLKFSTSANGWEQLSSLLARDKISHALRFANREKKSSSSSTTTTKPRSTKSHRRNGSDTTVSTAATELSAEDFDFLLDDEPLDWNNDADANASAPVDDEPKPYAYPIYESAPAPAAAYPHHSYGQPYYRHPHHAYGHGYYHPQSYHYYASYPAAPMPQCHHEYDEETSFPEKPLPHPPVRDSSMDVDLSYLVSEPLMDWELEPEQVDMVNT